jgi:hypothetical protein
MAPEGVSDPGNPSPASPGLLLLRFIHGVFLPALYAKRQVVLARTIFPASSTTSRTGAPGLWLEETT